MTNFQTSDLPSVEQHQYSTNSVTDLYICSVGFEDRAFAHLKKSLESGGRINYLVGIQYSPQHDENKLDDFDSILSTEMLSNTKYHALTYDRYNPDDFSLDSIKDIIIKSSNIVVDISGMSKLLIVVILDALKTFDAEVLVIYTEAVLYHPTQEYYDKLCAKFPAQETPVFLTDNVQDVVTTRSLTSISMQGQPTILLAFLTFNHRELTALVSELSPQQLHLIIGIPRLDENQWRSNALRKTNAAVAEYAAPPQERRMVELPTFDYRETVRNLEGVYHAHCTTHRIVIAPTGSKLQTLSVFFLKILHPDIQIVYPVTKTFMPDYSEGIGQTWQVKLGNIKTLYHVLDRHRRSSVLDLLSSHPS